MPYSLMKKLFITALLFGVVLVSCTKLSPLSVSSDFVAETLMATEEVMSDSQLDIAITSSEDTVEPIQNIIVPQLIYICPETQIVPIEKLEIPKDFRLLLLPSSVKAYPQIPSKPLSLFPEASMVSTIFDYEIIDYSVSPDHRWIYFYLPSSDQKYQTLWVSSIDGKEQWPVIELSGKGYSGYASWVSEKEIFIIGSPNESDISVLDLWDYMPFLSVNPFILEQRQLTYLARDPIDGLFYYGAISLDEKTYGMYGRLNRVDFIYDYSNDRVLPAFLWLDAVEPFAMQFIKLIWVYDNKFAVTIAQSDGIDLAFNLNIQLAGEDKLYNDVMERVIFPERLLPASVLGIVPGRDSIAMRRFDFLFPSENENWFYVFDYKNQYVADYCFDTKDSVNKTEISPDGRFVAFSFEKFDVEYEQEQFYIVVLDIVSGKRAYLEGYVLVGWGIVAP